MSYEYAAQLDVTRAENEAKDLRLSKLDLQIQAALVIILITIAFFIFYYFRRRKQIQELRHAYDQLADTTTAKERIDSELRIARDIQMSMVPRTFPAFPDRRDIDLHAAIVPAKEVGGDLYDFFLQDDRLCFCVGDVSGKGIPASLTMAVAVNLFRTVAKEGFPPEVIATKLNDTMSANNENAVFVTMFIGIIDLKAGHLDYCNCGHNSPVFGERRMHTAQTVFSFLDVESNVPIGLWPDYTFVGGHLDDIRGSSLFVYTDGVNEAENHMQEQFGEKRMLRVLRESTQPFGERTPKTRSHFLIDEMKYALDAFVDGAEQSDDLTMLCVSIK
jgi:serine phosphatase RsbU (regulator of sigma subunit)